MSKSSYFVMVALLAIAVPAGPASAGKQDTGELVWSGARRVNRITATEGLGYMRLRLGGSIPNPASCNGLEVDVPLDTVSAADELQVKLMTDAVFAAYVADLEIYILVDGNTCSDGGRRQARGIRIRPNVRN